MERNEDNINTEPVFADNARIVFETIRIGAGERGEIVLVPKLPMERPVLFMSIAGSKVNVEEIIHGHTALARSESWSVAGFRFGHRLDVTVTKDEYLKIIIFNEGLELTTVGASLVCSTD